jgi:hypothetical protein
VTKREKIRQTLKAAWKFIKSIALPIAAVILTIIGVKKAAPHIRRALQVFHVARPKQFRPSAKGERHIEVQEADGKWVDVELPEDVVYYDVQSAGLSETGQSVQVEVKHEKIDLSNLPPADSSNRSLDI